MKTIPTFFRSAVLTVLPHDMMESVWKSHRTCCFRSLWTAKGFWRLSITFTVSMGYRLLPEKERKKVGQLQLHEPMHVSRITFYGLHKWTGGTNTSGTSGHCPLTLSVCSVSALPAGTRLWPSRSECLGQHTETSRNPKMTCCEICRTGMQRARADGK